MLHSGLDYKFDNGEHYVYLPPANTPQEVAQRYNKCWYANAMRREDGFELANIEAPLANAMPITLERPCYRNFFSKTSWFVREDNLVDNLESIFINAEPAYDSWSKELYGSWPKYKRAVMEKFNWRDTVEPFWEKIRCRLLT